MESSKQLFQQRTEEVKIFRELIVHPAMKIALLHAQAEMMQYGLSSEQMSGARQFVAVLTNLGENDPPSTYPVKQLEVMDQPMQIPNRDQPQTKKKK